MDEPRSPGQEYRYEMHWCPGLVGTHWEVKRRPRASQRPRGEPKRIASGWSLTLDGAISRAARVIRRERDATRPPDQTLAEAEVLHLAGRRKKRGLRSRLRRNVIDLPG